MTTFIIIGCAALVSIVLVIFGIWYANQRGQQEGAAALNAKLQQKAADDERKASDILAEHRSDDDTAERLRRGDF